MPASPPLLRRPAPAPYFHRFFEFYRFPPPPPSRGGNQNLLPPEVCGPIHIKECRLSSVQTDLISNTCLKFYETLSLNGKTSAISWGETPLKNSNISTANVCRPLDESKQGKSKYG